MIKFNYLFDNIILVCYYILLKLDILYLIRWDINSKINKFMII